MDHKEKDAKSQLFDRLDECLTWAIRRMGQRSSDMGLANIYELQALIELHRYLKTSHTFAFGEVDALLRFNDPLDVAQKCWQENGSAPSFPICKILSEIGAYERFTLTLAEQERRKQPQVKKLKEVLDKNIADYTTALLGKSKQELIEGSEGITATMMAYSYMRSSYEYEYGEPDLLLKLDDPLKYLASRWSLSFDPYGDDDDVIQEIITDLEDPENLRCAQKATTTDDSREGKPSIRGQLHTAMREVGQHPPQEGQSQHQSYTPDL